MLPRNRMLPAGAVLATSLLLAACGSTLSPEEAALQGALGSAGSGGTVPGAEGGSQSLTGGAAGAAGDNGATTGGAGGDTGGSSATTSAPQTGRNAADSGVKAGNCAGFKNQTGVTDDKIVIANASDISGPIPGLFESAQEGVKAYVAYFNATSDICGRKLELQSYDTRTDSGGDQEAAVKACESAFAMVGSMSAFDNGGTSQVEECGIPDLRSATVDPGRYALPNVFGTQSNKTSQLPTAVPQYIAKVAPEGKKAMGLVYTSSAAAGVAAEHTSAAFEKNGYDIVYQQEISSTEFNYSPYVLDMEQEGVKFVMMIGAYQHTVRLAKAMDQQGYNPDAYVVQASSYDQAFLETGGSAVEDTLIYTDSGLFEQPTPELRLYQQWLAQVAPDSNPAYFGQYGWGATRLFVEKAIKLGGDLNRESMVRELGTVRNYTANGMFAPQQVGPKQTSQCTQFVQVRGGKFVKHSPGKFMCQGLTDSGA
jgi:ABC-type branched-subunit amino acid transport system substrate-binding protein